MFEINRAQLLHDLASKLSLLRFLGPRYLWDHVAASRLDSLMRIVCHVKRRKGWFLERLTLRRALNLLIGGSQWLLKSESMYALPSAVKIDISPMCNLHCTVCVHAYPNKDPSLESQVFRPQHRMSVEQFRATINQIRGRCATVSLYYVGDPLVHPDVDEMCAISRDAGLNVHICTNFNFALSDARIRRMVTSGLTHLSVCVDGLSQEKYEMTRVGGRIDCVLDNLQRVCKVRNRLGRVYPKVEVQYIKFQHNLNEVEPARRIVEGLGVDVFTEFWGDLSNYTQHDPEYFDVLWPRKKARVPLCFWPHNSMVIKYNGDVIPCCSYRIGHQYSSTANPKILGNIFKTSLAEVWNNELYRQARRIVNDPSVVEKQLHLKDHFCYGCSFVFETTDRWSECYANKTAWEDLYTMDPAGRPVRKKTAA